MRCAAAVVAGLVMLVATQANARAEVDANNPTCPRIDSVFGPLGRPMVIGVDKVGGRRVLKLQGAIAAGLGERIRQEIKKHQPLDEVWLGSSGGDAAEGLKIGRVIREAGLPTRVPNGWGCASSCNFAFLGGPIRSVEPKGVFAVHMFTVTNSDDYRSFVELIRKTPNAEPILNNIARREQASAMLASESNDFIIRMGVSRNLLTEVMYPQKADNFDPQNMSTLRCLSAAEMVRYNVVNAD